MALMPSILNEINPWKSVEEVHCQRLMEVKEMVVNKIATLIEKLMSSTIRLGWKTLYFWLKAHESNIL